MTTPSVDTAPAKGFAPDARHDLDVLLTRIETMLDGCGASNRNDLLVIAIEALIEGGMDTGPQIVGAAGRLGFSRGHAGAVLGKSEGKRWRRGDGGVYRSIAG